MSAKVAIVMGSDNDFEIMEKAYEVLKEFGVESEVIVASAHRTPYRALKYAEEAKDRGIKVIIAGAGAAAHLGGVLAAVTTLPVIGVPIDATPLKGVDSLYSIVQMPSGVPVASVAINGAKNAGILALQILALSDKDIEGKLIEFKEKMAQEVMEKSEKVNKKIK
ncbi:MAG: 5-(carboxyamino)imidazole ribonucleotide mutase [Eubacteriales bacterium]|nr:5-(carboxyamino)imidazole ribonucleotide mutase [Eubacteriales bacterium]